MARNQEKAMSMLNRWTTMKRGWLSNADEKRPRLASEVKTIREAEKWRGQLLRDIANNISLIQDGSKGEHRIRDLNDQINKLLRIKHHWERRIKELGGADYVSGAPRITDSDGSGALGEAGYYYFGAAKELPGVRELFQKKVDEQKDAEHRANLEQYVDAEYYGFYEEDDKTMLKEEKEAEIKAHLKAEKEWNEKHSNDDHTISTTDTSSSTRIIMKSHVNVPSQQEIQEILLKKRKREVMEKYK